MIKIYKPELTFIDLFCGIGGFRIALEQATQGFEISARCVFSSDIDEACGKAYTENFGEKPSGDITKIEASEIPNHDVLLAGFPCQAFSIIGNGEGFKDRTRGTLFFEIARILESKRPKAFVLENVKGLVSHNKGTTIKTIMDALLEIGYNAEYKILNALNFGLPQKRERVFIVGFLEPGIFEWPSGGIKMKGLEEVLEPSYEVPTEFWASQHIRHKRKLVHKPRGQPAIWHENKAGNISSYPYSCALRANASYNYLLVNGERRLTPREMLRLQGFPDSFKIICSYSKTRTQAGNTIPIPVAKAVIASVIKRLFP